MRIDKAGAIQTAGNARIRRAQSGFAMPPDATAAADEPSPVEQSPAAMAAAAAALVSLSAMEQAQSAAEEADRNAALHGDAVLNAMNGVQIGLLDCRKGEALRSLSSLVSALPDAADPRLDAVLRGIAQRAAVELAKPADQQDE